MDKIYITYSTEKAIYALENEESINIITNKDYLKSRICINEFKAGEFVGNLYIVVGNSKFNSGYEDLEDISDFVEFEEFSMKVFIKEKLAIKIPKYISEYDILEVFNSVDKLDRFIYKYDDNYNFEENLAINIMSVDNLNFIQGMESILEVINNKIELFSSIDNTELPKNTLINIFNSRTENFDLKRDFIETMGEKDGFNFLLKKIVYSIVLRNYRNTDRKILGYGNTYPKESLDELNDSFMKKILYRNQELLENINDKMKNEYEKMKLFSDTVDFEYFIENSTGYIEFELAFLIDRFKNELFNIDDNEKLKDLYAVLDRTKSKFSFILNQNKTLNKSLDNLANLIDRLIHIYQYEENYNTLDGWQDFYKEKYIKNFNSLSSNNDIYKLINNVKLENKLEIKIKNMISEKQIIINENYEMFLMKNYKSFISTENNRTVSGRLHSLRNINKGKKIIFIVIDAMRWPIWEVINKIFEKYNYESINQDNTTLSMLPSVTSISRLSLFAGNNYKNLVNQKLEDSYSYSIKDEEKHIRRYFDDKSVSFRSGGKQGFKELMKKDADFYSFIYTDVDSIFHGLSDITEELIKSIFEEQVKNFVDEIENKLSEDEYNIVLATDHGSTDITNQNKIKRDRKLDGYLDQNNLKYSKHGEYYRIYSEHDVYENEYKELLDYFNKVEQKKHWHVINQEDMKDFSLPLKDIDGTNLFWIITKYPYYVSQTNGSNIHGGLTMDETIIPFVIMEKNRSGIKELEIFISGDLDEKTASDIRIEITNSNNINIENLVINSNELNLNYKINNILPKSKQDISYRLKLDASGSINSNFTFSYLARGEEKYQKINKNIIIKETSKGKISNKVNKSRSLDF